MSLFRVDDVEYEVRRVGVSDTNRILDFTLKVFRIHEPITSNLEASEADIKEAYSDLVNEGVVSNHSFMIFCKQSSDQLVAICLNSITETTKGKDERFNPDHSKDYDDEISNSRYENHKAGCILTFVGRLSAAKSHVVGPGTKLLNIDILSVHQNFLRKGLARHLVELSIKEAITAKYGGIVSTTTAVGSQQLMAKLGFHEGYVLPFSDYCYKGTPVFPNVKDGGLAGKLMVLHIQ